MQSDPLGEPDEQGHNGIASQSGWRRTRRRGWALLRPEKTVQASAPLIGHAAPVRPSVSAKPQYSSAQQIADKLTAADR